MRQNTLEKILSAIREEAHKYAFSVGGRRGLDVIAWHDFDTILYTVRTALEKEKERQNDDNSALLAKISYLKQAGIKLGERIRQVEDDRRQALSEAWEAGAKSKAQTFMDIEDDTKRVDANFRDAGRKIAYLDEHAPSAQLEQKPFKDYTALAQLIGDTKPGPTGLTNQ